MANLSRREFLKNVAFIGAGATAAGILGACAPSATPTPAAPAQTGGGEPAATEPTQAPAPAASEPVTLNVWFNFGAEFEPTVKRLEDEFTAGHENIKLDRTDVGDWDQMRQKTLTAFSAGTGPDIFRIAVFDTALYAVRNAVITLDDLVASEPTMGSKDVFIDGFLANVVYGGKMWALPWKGSAVAFYWNPVLFEAAGLDPETPPTTWDEVAEMAPKLTDESKQQFGFNVLYSDTADAMNFFGPLLYSWGGDLFDSLDAAAVTKAAFNTDQGVEALQYVLDMIDAKCVNPPGMTIQDAQLNGKVAMWIDGQWAAGSFMAKNPDFKFNTGTLPASPYGPGTTVTGGDHIAISSVCKNVEQAWEFLAYCNTPETETWYWPLIGGLPGRKEVASADAYAAPPFKAFMDQLAQGAKPRPGVPDISEILAKFMVQVQLAEFGEIDAKAALTQAEKDVNEILANRAQMSS